MFEIGTRVQYVGVLPHRKGQMATVIAEDSDNYSDWRMIEFDDNRSNAAAYGITRYLVPCDSIIRIVTTTELQTALRNYSGIYPITFYRVAARHSDRGFMLSIWLNSGVEPSDIHGALTEVYDSLGISDLLPPYGGLRGLDGLDDDGSDCCLTYRVNNEDYDVRLGLG